MRLWELLQVAFDDNRFRVRHYFRKKWENPLCPFLLVNFESPNSPGILLLKDRSESVQEPMTKITYVPTAEDLQATDWFYFTPIWERIEDDKND